MSSGEIEGKTGRSERRSSRRSGKKSSSTKKDALEKLKKYRETGERIKYEVEEESAVYDLVNEDEYAQLVQDRQEEEWIVDDDGGGYVDDGREIFDDDEKPAEVKPTKDSKKGGSNALKSSVKSSKITTMFSGNFKRKKKETNVTLEGDAILEDILNSISTSDKEPVTKVKNTRTPIRKKNHSTAGGVTKSEKKFVLKTRSHMKTQQTDRSLTKIKMQGEQATTTEESGYTEIVDEEENFDTDVEEVELNGSDVRCNDIKKEDASLIEDGFENEFTHEMLIEADVNVNHSLKVTTKSRSVVDWENVFDNKEETLPQTLSISSSIPTTTVNGEEVLRFFWLDAYEDRYNQPGTVYLFGKVWMEASKCHVSCCVAVKNIERQLYFLPRETRYNKDGKDLKTPVDFKDVYEELDQHVMSKYQIMQFKCRKSKKKYAFEIPDVPHTAEYMEVLYASSQPQLPSDLKGQTFSHVFGTNTSSLELLFLNQKLQGPSWIDIKYPQLPKQSISWCNVEAFVDKPSFVSVVGESIPPPPLTVLSLSMISTTDSKTHAHEIISLCGLIHSEVHLDRGAPEHCFHYSFCFVSKPSDQLLPYDFQSVVKSHKAKIEMFPSERSMLGLLLAKVQTIDPDVIVGHDIHGFDLDVLLNRLNVNKVAHWSKIGRLKRTNMPKHSNKHGLVSTDKSTCCGRLVCDVKISTKELLRCKSYDLTEICSVVLNKQRVELQSEAIPKHLLKSESLLNMLNNNRADAMYQLQLMYELNILPLAYQITGICGNVMSRTLLSGRSERNEFLLLHAFSKRDYILPDKTYRKKEVFQSDEGDDVTRKRNASRKKPAYSGGLVLEPKKGFYDKYILLLDFNSLYPSIIQEYNICFTTIIQNFPDKNSEDEDILPDVPSTDLEPGILPLEIKRLVERRKEVKKLLKTVAQGTEMYLQYDIRQKALKLTANSMYGCLGFSHSRFYAKLLAALVTGKGREILMKTKDLAQNLSLDVIYGDTDSIMINTNSEDLSEVRKIGAKVKAEVNKLYKLVEIDIDGIFKSMLLLKKKKYAAVLVETKPDGSIHERTEMKGLDIVRRDWCQLAKDTGNYVLNEILSSKPRDTILENVHDYLRAVAEKIEKGEVELEKFEINKSLTKNPDDYPDKKSLPHVTVAQRLLSQGRRVAVGDTIRYVICDDNTKMAATQRAYHPDECVKNNNLKIDNHYYLSSQIHPVVARLCDPIEGTDAAYIASCLGLDPSAYKSSHRQDSEQAALTVLMSEQERFKEVDHFFVRCYTASCELYKKSVEFMGSFDSKLDPFQCTSCKETYHENRLVNSLKLFMRDRIGKYYSGWMTCDDLACGCLSRTVSVKNFKYAQICQHCGKGTLHAEYTDSALYNQLFYLSRLFDANRTTDETIKRMRKENGLWKVAQNEVENVLRLNAYSVVNIGQLF